MWICMVAYGSQRLSIARARMIAGSKSTSGILRERISICLANPELRADSGIEHVKQEITAKRDLLPGSPRVERRRKLEGLLEADRVGSNRVRFFSA